VNLKKNKMKLKWINAYIDTAERFAELSSARRLKVGSIIVKENRIISIGYNGMPAGWDNDCEYKDYNSLHDSNYFELKTRPEVLHAEENALIKLARDGESGKDASLFVTHAPCIQCAKLIYGAGIKDVYYKHTYRDTAGLDFLFKCGISITKIGEK
jgi:dCMP deaminase